MIKINSIPIPNPDVVGHIVDDQAVVVIPEHGSVKVFNEVGTHIWERIDGKLSVGDIVNLVCEEFDVEIIIAEGDTLEFISFLIDQDIVYLE